MKVEDNRTEAPPREAIDRRRWAKRALIVGVGAFAFGYLVTAFIVFGGGSGADVVTVPDVRTLAVQAARRTLEQSELRMEIADSLPNARVPHGAVVAQTPLPGQEVAPETPVRIILSQGPGRRVVPSVEVYSAEHAERILVATGFTVEVQPVEDLRAEGRVVGTEPAAGASVPIPATVQLLVSSGPPLVEVPLVIGLSEGEARGALATGGLRVGEVFSHLRTDVPHGMVLAQVPAPRDSVRAGAEVRLFVATHQPVDAPEVADPLDDEPGDPALAPEESVEQ